MDRRTRRPLAATLLLLVLALSPAAARAADLDDTGAQWLPRSDGAEWVYTWSDSVYSPTPRNERYQVTGRDGRFFRVSWSDIELRPYDVPAAGFADFNHTDAGLVNSNYQSTPAPAQFPLLCATAIKCGNSLAGSYFLMFWGTRSPVLAEPLVRGTRWNSLGGADNDVAASNRYLGRQKVAVPAFPAGIMTAKVESDVSHAGALGDPYGSGLRTVWWAYGVGPVKIVFQHAGGETTTSVLRSTTLPARALPTDESFMPLAEGARVRFRWRNDKHMKQWSRQQFTTSAVVSNSARVEVRDLAGPIDLSATYLFSNRLGGVRLLSSTFRRNRTAAKLPQLGPRKGLNGRRHFFTPYDLMTFGYNPVVPAYAAKGQSWRSSLDTRDWRVYGVRGVTRIVGRAKVRTPAGRFLRTLVVRSKLRQGGARFGSGTRTSWFAPGKGLVKLVFRHDDGSVSTVERIK
jgi:hypothetical protein